MIKGQGDRAKYRKQMMCEALLQLFLLLAGFFRLVMQLLCHPLKKVFVLHYLG